MKLHQTFENLSSNKTKYEDFEYFGKGLKFENCCINEKNQYTLGINTLNFFENIEILYLQKSKGRGPEVCIVLA